MSKIFVRERHDVGKGAGKPRFAVVAIQGADLKVFAPHIRKSELEALAAAVEAEIVYLPRGEKADREDDEGQGSGRRRKRWQGRQD